MPTAVALGSSRFGSVCGARSTPPWCITEPALMRRLPRAEHVTTLDQGLFLTLFGSDLSRRKFPLFPNTQVDAKRRKEYYFLKNSSCYDLLFTLSETPEVLTAPRSHMVSRLHSHGSERPGRGCGRHACPSPTNTPLSSPIGHRLPDSWDGACSPRAGSFFPASGWFLLSLSPSPSPQL